MVCFVFGLDQRQARLGDLSNGKTKPLLSKWGVFKEIPLRGQSKETHCSRRLEENNAQCWEWNHGMNLNETYPG